MPPRTKAASITCRQDHILEMRLWGATGGRMTYRFIGGGMKPRTGRDRTSCRIKSKRADLCKIFRSLHSCLGVFIFLLRTANECWSTKFLTSTS